MVSRIPASLIGGAVSHMGEAGNSTEGYFGGGGPGVRSSMTKITYSTDTVDFQPSGSNLSLARSLLAATGNSTAGYFGGGYTPSYVSTMDKLTYSNDTTTYTPTAVSYTHLRAHET